MDILQKSNVSASKNIDSISINTHLSKTTTYHFDGRKFVVTPIFRQESQETLGGVLLKLMQTENA